MLLTYVVAVLVVVAILYGSFRALGGGEPVPAQDYATVLRRLAEFTGQRAEELRAALDGAPAPGPTAAGEGRPSDPAAEAAGSARKKLGGYLQQLSRLELGASEADRPALDAARSLLETAIEDLGWACRMVEAGVHSDNPGIQAAVEALRAHGAAALEGVAALVGTDPAEPEGGAAS